MPTTDNVILHSGRCMCLDAPMGQHGLEGYVTGDFYHFEHMSRDRYGQPYFRVYPVSGSDYYETCSPVTFKRFFEVSDHE